MTRKTLGLAAFALLLLASSTASAQIPRIISFQGRLADGSGNLITGSLSFNFSIWTTSVPGEGSACFAETHSNLTLTNGLFTANIGSKTTGGIAPGCTFGSPYYLEVKVVGDDGAMAPRVALTAMPYALRAAIADDTDKVNGYTMAALVTKPVYAENGNCVAGMLGSGTTCTLYTYSGATASTCTAAAPGCPAGCGDQGTVCEWTGYTQPSWGCATSCTTDKYGTVTSSTCDLTGPSASNLFKQRRKCSCTGASYGAVR
ncbi:MAG TPA: hypothetical protein VGQ83_34530 [Polyangia bacterium]